MILELGPYKIDIDVESTRRFYESEMLDGDFCTCDDCRNYRAAIPRLPAHVTDFFAQMGADLRKASRYTATCSASDGTVVYDVFLHLCGTVLEMPRREGVVESVQVLKQFSVSFGGDCDLLEENFPSPVIQASMFLNVPWVLSDAKYD